MKILHTDKYTIREIVTDKGVSEEAWNQIIDATEFAFNELGLSGHLFITVIECGQICNDDGCGVGNYSEGSQSVIIAGEIDEEFKEMGLTQEDFLVELATTVIHECLHYKEDLEAVKSGGSPDFDEDVADAEAYRLVRKFYTEKLASRVNA